MQNNMTYHTRDVMFPDRPCFINSEANAGNIFLHGVADPVEQSSCWEALSRSVNKEIPLLFFEPEESFTLFIGPYSKPFSPVLITIPLFFKIHFNIILHSVPRSSKRFFSSDFPTKILYRFHFLASYMPRHITRLLISVKSKGREWIA